MARRVVAVGSATRAGIRYKAAIVLVRDRSGKVVGRAVIYEGGAALYLEPGVNESDVVLGRTFN